MGDDIIRSRQNAHIKRLRALFARGARDEGQAAIEGEHLLQEALRSGIEVREIFLREDAAEKFSSLLGNLDSGVALHVVAADAFDSAGATDAPQGIAAIIAVPQRTLASALAAPNPLAAFLDGIQDPGNVGTIIRSAEAFGASAVITLPGTASAWNLKAVRASAGSIFRLPVFCMDDQAAYSLIREYKLDTVAAVARGGIAPADVPWKNPTALLIGSEGQGLSQLWLERAQTQVTLATSSAVESLNAAVAASLLLSEASKMRSQ